MLGLFAALLIGQAARVQLVQGKEWAEKAKRQQFNNRSVAAARGSIFDAAGNILGQSREMVRINIAPNEVKNATAISRSMRDVGIDKQWIRAALDRKRKWITLPGIYSSADVASLTSLAGVHSDVMMSREYAAGPGIRRIVGNIDPAGRPLGGIELALDSILRGDSAMSAVARDVKGRRMDSPDSWESGARAGDNVTLTINRDLQEICERALARAVDSLQASGGDIVVLNPMSGDVLAMASLRLAQKSFSITAVTEPFEPGSTLKPFIAAALIERNRARASDVVDTHNGQLVLNGRTITDIHKAASMDLADVIRYSSNIGIVEFGSRLNRREKYETLRDIGLGLATGVPLPGESDGTLRDPKEWSGTSEASVLMGYEVAVTPLQLATAYGALANGGELLQPNVIKEIRTASGDLKYQSKRRVLRRVFPEAVTAEVKTFLRSVVDSGTALKAGLASFEVAGKSGTARLFEKGKGYAGNYTASFVGMFPAEKPQFVILVKLDSPQRAYYGGEVAAPVMSMVLRTALAARNAALDRSELATVERDVPLTSDTLKDTARASITAHDDSIAAALPASPPAAEAVPQPRQLFRLPYVRTVPAQDKSLRAVPDVTGLPTRSAVRALHRAGFRVTLTVVNLATPTVPAAGTMLPAGSIVKLQHIP
jgi:cell division protein FtsI (penicillin-binding protein 3)